jgi:hypothetical protein
MWRWRNNHKELLSTWNGSCLYICHNYEPLIGYHQVALDKTNFQAKLMPLSQWMAPPIRVARLSWWGFCAIILSGANKWQAVSASIPRLRSVPLKDVTVSQFVDTFEFFSQLSNASLTNRKIDSHKNTLFHATNIIPISSVSGPCQSSAL